MQPSPFGVDSPIAMEEIRDRIRRSWGFQQRLTHNPSPNPVSLLRKDLPALFAEEYVAAEKTDGVRYLLVLGRFSGSKRPFAVLVSRALAMFQLEVHAPSELFRGSVFDGELVWDDKLARQCFLAFDVVSIAGRSTRRRNFHERYETLSAVFPEREDCPGTAEEAKALSVKKRCITCIPGDAPGDAPGNAPPVHLYAKRCMPFRMFEVLVRASRDLPHKSDGYIFTPVRDGVARGRSDRIFKWKHRPTIDVRLQRGGEMTCMVGHREVPLREAIPDLSFALDRKVSQYEPEGAPAITEMEVDLLAEDSVRCTVLRAREDKRAPNQAKTIRAVVQEVRENITLEELQRQGKGIEGV